jgi:hypothetical protein
MKALRDGRLRPSNGAEVKGKDVNGSGKDVDAEQEALLRAAAVMFGDLVDDLGPPLKALSVSLSSIRAGLACRQLIVLRHMQTHSPHA